MQRVARGRSGARKAERVAAEAMVWGDPMLPSAICTVVQGRLWYRGHDAIVLAATKPLEGIAGLLWEGEAVSLAQPRRPTTRASEPNARTAMPQPASALPAMFAAMAARAWMDPPCYGRAPHALRTEAAQVLSALAAAVLPSGRAGPLHERLARGWRCPAAAEVVRRALVLLADHELNASAFAVRVTVSTGASLAAGVLAGLATLSGPLHGRASAAVAELIREGGERTAHAAVREWLMQGRALSGFGHPLYPDGDVRAQALLQVLRLPPQYEELRACVHELTGEHPNIDFALAAMSACFRLPPDAPLALFAVARTVGWLAHAMEQAAAAHLIRPRARYTGPPVGSASQAHPI